MTLNAQFAGILGSFNLSTGTSQWNPGGFNGMWLGEGATLDVHTPINGARLATVQQVTRDEYELIAGRTQAAFLRLREIPAPKRGELSLKLAEAFAARKRELGRLISLEMGKIQAEGEGEVQEMVDIFVLAAGLARMLCGRTIPSERVGYQIYEYFQPLGPVGVISAWNFPAAVWAWNAALAVVCGDPTLWKPSSKAPLTAIASTKIAAEVCEREGFDPAILGLIIGGGSTIGEYLINDDRFPLISATGSCEMGERVAVAVAKRLGKSLLELGGNNAVVVSRHADIDLAVQVVLFGAVGTAGQRCTTTRRVIVHKKVYKEFVRKLLAAYKQVPIGNPLEPRILMGPMVDPEAVETMQRALLSLEAQGGNILYGGQRLHGRGYPGGCYVVPCIAEGENAMAIVQEETFAPILYLIVYDGDIDEAIAINNDVPQGLSSAVITRDLGEAERFRSAAGADTGLVNVNGGTSGAEIGGAFGGNKKTGWGRESGSNAWEYYTSRRTSTVFDGRHPPTLAQGISFSAGGRQRSKKKGHRRAA